MKARLLALAAALLLSLSASGCYTCLCDSISLCLGCLSGPALPFLINSEEGGGLDAEQRGDEIVVVRGAEDQARQMSVEVEATHGAYCY